MQWIAAKVTFSCDDEELTAALISDIFQDLGLSGVVVDDPHLEPSEGWGSDAVPLPSQPAVTGYLHAGSDIESKRHNLEEALDGLSTWHSYRYTLQYGAVDEEDWAESWKDFFYPEQITPHIVVKPTWREYSAEPDQLVIEIDPGMAFGTGTHPTTALCIQLLEKYIHIGDAVLDVGTGSGILLITAAKMGAGRLTGIDLDPVAVTVARQNFIQNRIEPEAHTLHCGHLVEMVCDRYEVVVANILADVVIDLLDQVPSRLEPGGLFICSGIIQAYRDKVVHKMVSCGFEIDDILEKGEWVAIAGRLI